MEQKSKVVIKLRELGLNIDNTWDLLDKPIASYVHAIPVLLEFLNDESLSFSELEGIVRSLLVKEARFKYNDSVFRIYDRIPIEKRSQIGWVYSSAIWDCPRKQDFERIYEIVKEPLNGTSRREFIRALGKLKDMRAEDLLIEFLDIDGYKGQSIYALGMLKSKKAKEKIESFLNHPNKFFQRQAKTALKRIG